MSLSKTSLLLCFSLFIFAGCTQQASEENNHDQNHEDGHIHNHDHDHAHGHEHDHPHDHSHDGSLRSEFADDLDALMGHAPNHGVMVPLFSEESPAGFAEVKLHDDKGDLELWLSADEAGSQAMDFPLDLTLTLHFPELEQESVTLQIRNAEQNEDENGKGTIRDQKTNYFIFPGDSGVDASFLTGKTFSTPARLSFSSGEKEYTTKVFTLIPHQH